MKTKTIILLIAGYAAIAATGLTATAMAADITLSTGSDPNNTEWHIQHEKADDFLNIPASCNLVNNKHATAYTPSPILSFADSGTDIAVSTFSAIYAHKTSGTEVLHLQIENSDYAFNIPMTVELNQSTAHINRNAASAKMFAALSAGHTLTATYGGEVHTIDLTGFAENYRAQQVCVAQLVG